MGRLFSVLILGRSGPLAVKAWPEYNRVSAGGMAEWLKAAVLKTAFRFPERGFESLSLRHSLIICGPPSLFPPEKTC
jgi:hypothetical protein